MSMQMRFRPTQRAPDELGGVKILYPKAPGKAHKIAWYAILFAVLSPIALLLTGVVGSWLTLTANGRVFLEQDEIRAASAGRISQLNVAAGDLVEGGKTLAVLENSDLDAAAAHNAVERQAAAEARRFASAQQQSAADELRLREQLVRYQRDRRADIARLVSEGAATVAELNAAESAATDAEVALLRTRAAAERAPALSTAEVDHDLLESRQRALTLAAPYQGRVLELLARQGEYVSAGEPLLLLARIDHPRVVAYASPKFASRLRVGMRATIHFPDGTRTLASVAEPPRLTQRMPADLVDQFGLRPMTVVLNLLPEEQLTDSQRVQGLPVSVRFHYDWESSAIGRAVGALLGVLSR
jgi:multidrug resistance efflux pump